MMITHQNASGENELDNYGQSLLLGADSSVAPWDIGNISSTDHPAIHSFETNTDGACLQYSRLMWYTTYLMYKPDNGIWVQLATTSSLLFHASQNWSETDQKYLPDITPRPTTDGGPDDFTPIRGFLAWDSYQGGHTWSPPFTPD
jgi:hypothetical protein